MSGLGLAFLLGGRFDMVRGLRGDDVQDGARLFGGARGLPISFHDYRLYGHRIVQGTPVQGHFIQP